MKKSYIYYILIVAFTVRLLALNQSFWLDEATTATVAKNLSWSQYFNSFLPGDFHPPLYYILAKIWGLIFGVNEPSLRMLSVFFGIVSIYLVYKITRLIANNSIALLAALLLTFAPLHIYYSQEARMYSLIMALSTALIFSYLLFKKKQTVSTKIYLLLSAAALIYTNYLAALMFIPIFWDYHQSKKAKKLKAASLQIALAVIIIVAPLIYLVALPQFSGLQSASSSNWGSALGEFNLKNILLIPIKFTIGRINFGTRLIYALMVAVPAAVYAFIIYKAKPFSKNNNLITNWLFVPIIAGIALSLFAPVLSYFRFIFVLPALYILLAIGLNKHKDDHFLPLLLVVLLFNLYFSYHYLNNPRFYREDWRGLVNYINEVDEDPTIIFPGNSQQEAFKYYSDISVNKPSEINKSKDRVWLLRYAYDISDPADTTRKQIEEMGYQNIDQKDFNGVIIWEYAKQK